MPTLSNGSELTVWEEPENPNPSPDAILFNITETDDDVIGPVGAVPDFFYGGVDLASIDVFDGFFTITSFTHEGRTETWTMLETRVFDNEGNLIRAVSDRAAYLSAEIVSVSADSPDDVTVTWIGANEYFGGENTRYGQHQIILDDGALQPDTFVNHPPTVADLEFTMAPGQSLDDIEFSAEDLDYDLLSFTVVDPPDHGALAQETLFDGGYYPFHQGHYGGSLHYHGDFLSGNYFDYVPQAGFTGTDSFTVYATDGQGHSNLATVTITVMLPTPQSISLTAVADVMNYEAYDHPILVDAAGGNDRIAGTRYDDTLDGGDGNDLLRGAEGDDTIFGGTGGDRIFGGSGKDVINGGAGPDLLTGGRNSDVFIFDSTPGEADADKICDFTSTVDEIRLDSTVFEGLATGALDAGAFVMGTAAADADDRVIYDMASGQLLYDPDGAGGETALLFATLGRDAWLAASDFYVV